MKHALSEFGWNDWFTARFEPFAALGLRPARVAIEHRSHYELYSEAGPVSAVLAGKLRYSAIARTDLPAVGDWVAAAPRPEGEATIHGVVPRRSAFVRRAAGHVGQGQVAAANIDVAFVVTSCNAEFNPRRLERYLGAAWESGAEPVVLLTKADLAANVADLAAAARAVAGSVPVIVVSALTELGVEAVRTVLAGGRTGAMLGSSGVGKSTLINRLLGEERLATASVRDSDDKGRHTTTRRELVPVPGGGLLIDTPGMRQIEPHESGEGMLRAFADVQALALECSFADCRHGPEPGCAVTAAVADGRLTMVRRDAFQRLTAEQTHEHRKVDQRAGVATKAPRKHDTRKRGS